MKNKCLIAGILVMLLVFGMTVIGCDDELTSEMSGQEELSEDVWKDGNITAEGQVKEYLVKVTTGTMYFIWWNDSDNTNDLSKTCDIKVSARYSDGTPIFTGVDTGWQKPKLFTAASSGTVILSVQAMSYSKTTGTYAIKYTTHSSRTAISENEWKDDSLIADDQANEYSLTVTSGKIYFIWWNDSDNTNDLSKTCDVKVSARYSDGTPIFTGVDTGWQKPKLFVAANNGTVILSVQAMSYSKATGTYAVRYTTRESRINLSSGTWVNDSLIADSQVNEYSFTVQSGSTYYIWWNDYYQGDNSKTCDVKVSARYSEGSSIFTGIDSGWTTPQPFTAASSGTVIVSVQAYGSNNNTGTYALVYATSISKP
jgi:hypothetical protein